MRNRNLRVAQNGIVLELRKTAASQNCPLASLPDKRGEWGYCDESDVL